MWQKFFQSHLLSKLNKPQPYEAHVPGMPLFILHTRIEYTKKDATPSPQKPELLWLQCIHVVLLLLWYCSVIIVLLGLFCFVGLFLFVGFCISMFYYDSDVYSNYQVMSLDICK